LSTSAAGTAASWLRFCKRIYARAGFTLTDVFSIDSGMHVIEGAPA
jgi:hypothetical protein